MNIEQDPWSDEPSTPNGQKAVGKSEETGSSASLQVPSSVLVAPSSIKSPGGRGKPKPRRYGATPTDLAAIDDSLGPFGPLGAIVQAEPDGEPKLPREEPPPTSSDAKPWTDVSHDTRRSTLSESPYTNEQKHRSPRTNTHPPLDLPGVDGVRTQRMPSLSVEQAAKPTFSISVGDPHKVGDLTSSHTNYLVRTKTTSKAYRVPEFEVSRRYRDFLWLYNQLHSNNPGIVVPPPPEKQAVGRFDTGFVESRRAAMDRMLNKIAAHPTLQHDADLKLFLESDAFSVDVKHRERKDPDMPVESKGMFSGLSLSVGSGSKFIEHDEWFLERRIYLDNLESQLKALLKSTDAAVAQRKALADASLDLSTSLNTLSQVELSPTLSGPLASLSDLHLRVRDLYDRQAQQDVLTLGSVIDEYIRLIGSIKKAFEQRQKSWQNWHTADSDLQKRKSAMEKMMRQGRSQQDRLSQLQADVGDAERRAHQARLQFEELGKAMRAELERFEREKVEDFRMAVETYLESAVEAQKELIELWETFLMRLDADEDGAPPLTPWNIDRQSVAEPAAAVGEDTEQTAKSEEDREEPELRVETAALAQVQQEA